MFVIVIFASVFADGVQHQIPAESEMWHFGRVSGVTFDLLRSQ